MSLTNPDARHLVKSGQGVAGYNVQVAVDDKHKLMIASEVVNDSSDVGQLHAMAKAAKEALDAEALQALADEGYYSSTELKACEDDGIKAYVPVPKGTGKSRRRAASASRISATTLQPTLTVARRRTAASDGGALGEHQWPNRDPLCEQCEDLQGVPVKGALPEPDGISADHRSLGTRRRSRTSSRADARRKRVDAPSFGDCRASLWHTQVPRRLSPLPGPRPRQGARRMEPDGALLQLHPRAQYPRIRGLCDQHGKGIPVALARPKRPGRLSQAPCRCVLDKHAGLAPDQTLPASPLRDDQP